jgi:pyruvate/2-oxoglutarate dehydrogenase complex dihydrolipoamide dehydrogenase (E3) component
MTDHEPTARADRRKLFRVSRPRRPSAIYFIKEYHHTTIVESNGETMRDKYVTGISAAVGPGASAHETYFSQIWSAVGSTIDLLSLSRELAQVRAEMETVAADRPGEKIALAAITEAETASSTNDGPTVMMHLRNAGTWALDVAKSISAEAAVTAIRAAMGK